MNNNWDFMLWKVCVGSKNPGTYYIKRVSEIQPKAKNTNSLAVVSMGDKIIVYPGTASTYPYLLGTEWNGLWMSFQN